MSARSTMNSSKFESNQKLNIKPLEWIFFDLDDTLVNSTAAYQISLKSTGIDPSSEEFNNARILVKERLGENHPTARNRLLYFKCLLENRSTFTPQLILFMMDQYEQALEQNLARQWKDLHRERLLVKLKSKYKLAIITNENTRTQLIKLKAIDPQARFFNFIITSEEVGVEKPDPLIFETALKRAQTTVEKVLMVGDSLDNDIIPARRLGIQTLHTIEFLEKVPLSTPDHILALEQLLDLCEL